MTDLTTAAMTDQELELSLEHAHYCLSIAQTAKQRAQYMAAAAEIMREQERRGLR